MSTVSSGLYATLGIAQDATDDEIKKAYRKLAMQWHPDKNPDNKQAEEIFKRVAEAYSVLSDPVQRQAHDAGDAHEHAGFSRTNADDLFAEFFNGGDPFAEAACWRDGMGDVCTTRTEISGGSCKRITTRTTNTPRADGSVLVCTEKIVEHQDGRAMGKREVTSESKVVHPLQEGTEHMRDSAASAQEAGAQAEGPPDLTEEEKDYQKWLASQGSGDSYWN